MLKTTEEIDEALNEYFRLKNKFESDNMAIRKKIINNSSLSKKEKREEYLKLKPKCINCKKPSNKGTIFSVNYFPGTDSFDSYRIFKASCGNLVDPCNLNIQIKIGATDTIDKMLNEIKHDINEYKNIIINDKNKLLFGLIDTEEAINNFDTYKDIINDLTSIYGSYFDSWNNIYDNQAKKLELESSTINSYESINQIKECMKKYNETNNSKYAVDAATIYNTTLEPLLKKIRFLKYNENMVYYENNKCKLIQNKISLEQLDRRGVDSLVAFDVGLKQKQAKTDKKKLLIIEEESTSTPVQKLDENKSIPPEEPIIGEGKDGISWTNPAYTKLWNSLPDKLKNEFKTNIDWMNEFMFKCVNDKLVKGNNGCELTTPPNLIVPPNYNEETKQYDFGVSIYTKEFNKLPESLKKTYLTLYKEDPNTKIKNYSMLENAMNSLIGKQLDFGRGFF